MEDVLEISLLLDFYGQLLTERQAEMMDLHYNNDYSLGEIAEQLGISRQGVHDGVRRGKTVLLEMEAKLGLVARFAQQKEQLEAALTIASAIESKCPGDESRNLRTIIQKLLDA